MVTGEKLSQSMLERFIAEKQFATNFPAAIRKFGTQFIAVRPIPSSCINAIYELKDPDERVEENICYVPKANVF